jgi:predicted short-subunit dehydrogenase-like oxidoreductase (DUF2520 family)
MTPAVSVALIGAGNVGWRLGLRLAEQGFSLLQVYSRNPHKAHALAQATGALQAIHQLEALRPDADLYLLAVPDDAIAPTAEALAAILPAHARIAHTSGATPVAALGSYFDRRGIFYPLQTFSRTREVDFSRVPLCIYAPEPEAETWLMGVAHRLSEAVYRVDDEQRAILHLAAVFVNNFTNALYGIGASIVAEGELPFALLQPLIAETAAKVQTLSPQQAQTGPALRNDQATIERHLARLEASPHWQEIYRQLTEEIKRRRQQS